MAYLTVNPGLLVGKPLDLYGGHDVVNTSANIPSHILSIVLYADRRVLQCGCSFKHIPVCLSKTVLQDALSVWCPEFDLFSNKVCLFQPLSVCRIQEQRDVVCVPEVGAGCGPVGTTYAAVNMIQLLCAIMISDGLSGPAGPSLLALSKSK